MQEIKCPKCGEIFQVDESGYAEIVRQVRDKEFRQELERRETELTEKKDSELRLVRAEQERVLEARLAEQKEAASKRELEQKEESAERERRLREEAEKRERELREETEKREREQREAAERSRQELTELRAELDRAQQAQELAVIRAMQDREKQLADSRAETDRLRAELELQAQQSKLNENTLIERQRNELRIRDEEIERLKDFKTRQSTKMVGESLEQHCLTQFNSVRMMSFPNAYFEKDNDARTGSKGDFIFRESADGVEFISIMFEMKNETDTTSTKHKNEDFFKELDKDRCEKKCEYAVLVSLLESDSELYNGGIVDVSYRYPKMFVIRPQFFIPLISLLRNAALSSLSYRRELSIIRDRECDLTNFEDNINTFKESFARNYRIASDRFKTAIEEIDKTILHLQKTKDALLSSENNLRIANNKADELSIKRLTRNAPTVRAMLEDIKHGEESK
jgi:conserved hypothetical protein